MKRTLLFDANPLINTNKSGVGYLTHRLVEALAGLDPNNLELVGHYFNFLGQKSTTGLLPSASNIRYRVSYFPPTKLLNGLRKFGIEIPYMFFTRTKADIVLFPNFVSNKTTKGQLNVLAIHDLSFIDCPQYVSDKNGSYLRRWVPVSIQRADMIITISEFSKSRIMDIYSVPENKIHVISVPPAVPPMPDPQTINKFNIHTPYLLFVGTLEPRKNLLTLLEGYENLPSKVKKNYALVLAGGKGWKDDGILDKIRTLKLSGHNIIQTGYVSESEKAALYNHATLCVQPSYYEGFGMPILEALSFGKPVLCSDIEVFREVAGNSVEYFETENKEALVKSLSEILDNKTRLAQLGQNAELASNNIPSWHAIARNLYTRILRDLE